MPARDVAYRLIRAEEAKQIAAVHRSAFPEDALQRTIFASPKVDRLLACLIAHPEWQREHLFIGAWADDQLVGYAHYRVIAPSLHLNQIAVMPNHQGQGIGRGLLRDWRRMAHERGLSKLSLDVDESNCTALNWYRKLGLSPVARHYIYEGRIGLACVSMVPDQSAVELVDWESTWAWHRTFGISTVHIRYGGKTWDVGWIGRRFRAHEVPPPQVLGVLVRVCPKVSRLLVYACQPLSEEYPQLTNLELAATSVRMEACA